LKIFFLTASLTPDFLTNSTIAEEKTKAPLRKLKKLEFSKSYRSTVFTPPPHFEKNLLISFSSTTKGNSRQTIVFWSAALLSVCIIVNFSFRSAGTVN
jgi:hypothetical protein